jgi:uncharacterized OB-fold protein
VNDDSETPIASDTDAKARFWQSVEDRKLKLPFCRSCLTFFYYPRAFCPNCWSEEIEFRPAAGQGTIWSFTVVRFAHGEKSPWHERLPYVVALIEMHEGVRMMANVIDCDVDRVSSGAKVRLVYTEMGGRVLPAFQLAE